MIAPPSGMTASLPHCSLSGCVAAAVGSQFGPGRTALKKKEHASHVPSGRHCSGGIGGGLPGPTGPNTQDAQSAVRAGLVWPTTPGAQLSTSTLGSVLYLSTATQH